MVMFFNKVFGFDKVFLFVVKDCFVYILLVIINIINSFFVNFIFFWVWKWGEVVFYLKDGDYEVLNNNRFIFLLLVFFKVVERIVLC